MSLQRHKQQRKESKRKVLQLQNIQHCHNECILITFMQGKKELSQKCSEFTQETSLCKVAEALCRDGFLTKEQSKTYQDKVAELGKYLLNCLKANRQKSLLDDLSSFSTTIRSDTSHANNRVPARRNRKSLNFCYTITHASVTLLSLFSGHREDSISGRRSEFASNKQNCCYSSAQCIHSYVAITCS